MAKIIDGKALAQKIKEEIKAEVEALKKRYGAVPSLSVILAGDNSASAVYVANKVKACEQTGINSAVLRFSENVSEAELLNTVRDLNADENCHGILVQLPLPAHINEEKVLLAVSSVKDVDGFTPENAGKLFSGLSGFKPCTAAGIVELIKSTGETMEGKRAVVVGRSNIVGKPAAILLLRENATVTIAHSRTRNLKEICAEADILVAAIGKKEFITGDFIKEGATVIDVGINRSEGGLYGDVKFSEAAEKCAYITPVPGGVGPMTIALLLRNTVDAFKALHE